ncbi:MAG: hypothetical protein ABGY11_05265 [Candidatus Thioglobus sp.]|jgi:hypothetical protein
MKLTGKKKAAFLKRMALGRKKAQTKRKPAKRTVTKRRKPAQTKRKSSTIRTSKRSTNTMRRKAKRTSSRRSKGFGSFLKTGMIKSAIAGIGAGALAAAIVPMVAPQFVGIAKPVAALAAGGPIGAISQVVLDGGLSSFGSLFGGVSQAPTEVGV